MEETKQRRLEETAAEIRRGILTAVHAAKSGHPGGSLGAAEIFTYLYFEEMQIDPKNPRMKNRDRFVLSKGHTAPGLYATLAQRGFFPKEDLVGLRAIGSHLQGHPSMNLTPGVDMSTGSLGQGISAACGMALGARVNGTGNRVYALLGDGEIEEGECWEAFMYAAHHKLDNLCAIIDVNGLQIDGATKDVMSCEPIEAKMEAFGFAVFPVANGNSFAQLEEAFAAARKVSGKPSVIVARTTKGKGVSFMENQAGWHGKAPSDEQYEQALAELDGQSGAKGGN